MSAIHAATSYLIETVCRPCNFIQRGILNSSCFGGRGRFDCGINAPRNFNLGFVRPRVGVRRALFLFRTRDWEQCDCREKVHRNAAG